MLTPTGIELQQAIANMKAVENDREHFYKLEEPEPEIIEWTPFNPEIKPDRVKSEAQKEYEENECWRDNK